MSSRNALAANFASAQTARERWANESATNTTSSTATGSATRRMMARTPAYGTGCGRRLRFSAEQKRSALHGADDRRWPGCLLEPQRDGLNTLSAVSSSGPAADAARAIVRAISQRRDHQPEARPSAREDRKWSSQRLTGVRPRRSERKRAEPTRS